MTPSPMAARVICAFLFVAQRMHEPAALRHKTAGHHQQQADKQAGRKQVGDGQGKFDLTRTVAEASAKLMASGAKRALK
jgi:hypothetical protein